MRLLYSVYVSIRKIIVKFYQKPSRAIYTSGLTSVAYEVGTMITPILLTVEETATKQMLMEYLENK